MDLTWLDPAHLADRDVAAVASLFEAARVVDQPSQPGMTAIAYAAYLRHGWDGVPPRTGLSYDNHGRLAGMLQVRTPGWDNPHLGFIRVMVDPRERRRGLGRRLFDRGLDLAREMGLRTVAGSCPSDSAGAAFSKALGFEPAFVEAIRRLDVAAVDWSRLAEQAAAARPYAAGYELQRIPVPAPDDLLADIATMTAAINDAPTGSLDLDDETFPPERIQAYEQAELAAGQRLYRLVARHRDSGELAGHTVAAVEVERPWLAFQHDTSVVRAHRGHRLGLLLKIEMLQLLLAEEPQVRSMDTGNAADNSHMIAVNEAIGYHLIDHITEFQRRL